MSSLRGNNKHAFSIHQIHSSASFARRGARAVLATPKIDEKCQPVEKIEEALERDNFMSPDDAKKFGIIDDIQTKRVVEKTEK